METQINEIKISYHNNKGHAEAQKIRSSQDAAEILFGHWDMDTITVKESFKVLLLNNSNTVKGIYEISTGGITGTVVDIRILFGVVLKTLSVAIVLAHNHPSGALVASEADKKITEKIKRAAGFFDVKVLDHLILTPEGKYFSFADSGVL